MREIKLNLKKYRLKAGLTQLQVSKLLEVSSDILVGNWEKGKIKPRPAKVQKLAEIYKVDYTKLQKEIDIYHHYKKLIGILDKAS